MNQTDEKTTRYLFPLSAALFFVLGFYLLPGWLLFPALSLKFFGIGYLALSLVLYLSVLASLALIIGAKTYMEVESTFAHRLLLFERGPGLAGMDKVFAILTTLSAVGLGFLCAYSSWAFFLMPAAIAICVSFWLSVVSGNHELWPAASYTRVFPSVFPPPAFQVPDLASTPGDTKTLSWTFLRGGVQELTHDWKVFIPEEEVRFATENNPGQQITKLYSDNDAISEAAHLFTNPKYNSFLVKLAEKFHHEAIEGEYSLYEELSNVLACVQAIPYMTDEESTGQKEYWKFPVETLAHGCGDCEDKALLMCALCMLLFQAYPEKQKEHRLEVYLLVSFEEGHAAVAIGGPNLHLPERYYTYNGRRLYFCETTNNGRVGAIPEGVNTKSFFTISMNINNWGN